MDGEIALFRESGLALKSGCPPVMESHAMSWSSVRQFLQA